MTTHKILISQAWREQDVPHFAEYVKELESRNCEVVLYPSTGNMSENDILTWAKGCCAHICGGVQYSARVMDGLPDLKMIARIGVGYETVDIPAASERGILVATTPGAGAETVSEHAITMIAALSRRVFENDRMVRSGGWTTITGHSVYRRVLGIVGFGLIGRQLAKWAKGFDMKILAYDPMPDEIYAKKHGVIYVSLETLLKESDYVSLHLPLTPSTKGLIGENELALMKSEAFLINAARGGIVKEKALYQALKNRRIAGAALDVFEQEPIGADNPLLALDNVIFSPHMAGSTFEGLDAIVGMAVRNVCQMLDGETPAGLRNPEAFQRR
ncbi:MAG: phosphoglycerate dehydrogenase [Lachnospiraceae bacterium]|nr:phosphoglycerate dehydrogenase [Lachnospiraceae bacterium]